VTGTRESLRQHIGSISTTLTMGQTLLNRNASPSEFNFLTKIYLQHSTKQWRKTTYLSTQWKYLIALSLFCHLFTYIFTAFRYKRLFCRIQREKTLQRADHLHYLEHFPWGLALGLYSFISLQLSAYEGKWYSFSFSKSMGYCLLCQKRCLLLSNSCISSEKF